MMSPTQPKLRLRDKRRRLVWVKVASGTAVTAMAVGLIWYGAHRPEINIQNVRVEGAHLANAELVEDVVESELEDSYLFILPRSNIFLIPYDVLEKRIAESFPQVASVAASQSDLGVLTVRVTERVPVAKWCTDGEERSCYLMDGNGFIFEKNDGEGFVEYSGAIEGSPVGKQYLDGTFRNFSKTIEALMSATKRNVTRVVVDEYRDVYAYLEGGGVVIFVLASDYAELLDNIASVFASERFQTGAELEHADFRFGNKVYVKFVGE